LTKNPELKKYKLKYLIKENKIIGKIKKSEKKCSMYLEKLNSSLRIHDW